MSESKRERNRLPKMDLHMHTTVSDGTDSPEELLERVRKAGITLFAMTDHDAVKGCRMLGGKLRENDPQMLTGVEFSCQDEEGKYHILGYGFDPDEKPILQIIESGHEFRMKKLMKRLAFLRTSFGFVFPQEDIDWLMTLDNPGKPHLAMLMVKHGFASTKEQAFSDYLNLARCRSEYVRPEDAIRGILQSGGIPVLAHPAFGSGDELIVGEEMARRLRRLMDFGLQGVEAFYSGFSPRLRAETLSFAERFGLYVTAGSDYHGKNKLVTLGDTELDHAKIIPEGLWRFLERVCHKS